MAETTRYFTDMMKDRKSGQRLDALLADIAIDVKTKGAKGNWNGTTGTDNLAAFNAAVNALPLTGGTILVPDGDYWFSDAWVISKDNVTVIVSPNAILRTNTQTLFGGLLTFKGLGTGTVPTMKNGRVTGGGTIITPASLDNSIGFVRCDGCFVDDISVSSGHKGITTQQYNKNINIKNIRVLSAGTAGVALEDGIENADVNNIKIDSCAKGVLVTGGAARGKNIRIGKVTVDQSTGDGIQVSQCDEINIDTNTLSNIGGRGITIDNSSALKLNKNTLKNITQHGINLTNVTGYFIDESNTIDGVSIVTPNTYNARNYDNVPIPFNVKNNIVLGSTHKYAVNIGTSSGNSGVFKGNQFAKGQSDIDYSYNGWMPKEVDDLFGGKKYRLKDGAYREFRGTSIPSGVTFAVGDTVYNTAPTAVKNISHWVCRVAGNPGSWVAFGIGQGTTAQRPSDLTASDYNYMYYDTDLRKVICWNGFGWVV